MKTVSTKLSKEDFEKFQEMCNHEGQCISEELRELIKMGLDAYEDELEMEKEEKLETSKPVLEYLNDTSTVISHGKILDDEGNVIRVF